MKRFNERPLCLVFVVAFLLNTLMISSVSAAGIAMPEGKGDINGDGKANYYDGIIFKSVLLGLRTFADSTAQEQADVNDDGDCDSNDYEYFLSLAPVRSVWGDTNNDGQLSSIDLGYFRSYLLGFEIPVEPIFRKEYIWDVNVDGKIDSIDFAYIRGFILGTIIKLPIEDYVRSPIIDPVTGPILN
ncbi:dockerin type I repeat-containing protein [Acetivibrio cellulolyticus]|uniref:dockerin type I repeat-containing protein n=1 Tax=Acetivibrio cellulolyticus TaxID=35830 RepID=UPI0001E2DE23|nr:dockerin type I repeat-containing protein [Acetivibrio cellulolyticus]